jgi:drug/metabolite transporter (DMT)-like permease
MIPLVFSILCSSLIFVIFKLFPKYQIDTFQAIVFNYFTAFVCGIVLFGSEWNSKALSTGNWPMFVVLSGVLFISLFLLMGKSSQQNGVALTSIAVKMSMAISMLFLIVLYKESLSVLKITGIALAILGVFLVSFSQSNEKKVNSAVWMLFFLFVGSGFLDFILNYVQRYELRFLTPSLFSAFGFGVAGLIGLGSLIFQIRSGKTTFSPRSILAGIVLGIPNYFSIFLLMLSYKTTGWNDSTVLAITNVSVVLLAALLGFIAFKENVTTRKIFGLIAAIAAIVILYFANNL